MENTLSLKLVLTTQKAKFIVFTKAQSKQLDNCTIFSIKQKNYLVFIQVFGDIDR